MTYMSLNLNLICQTTCYAAATCSDYTGSFVGTLCRGYNQEFMKLLNENHLLLFYVLTRIFGLIRDASLAINSIVVSFQVSLKCINMIVLQKLPLLFLRQNIVYFRNAIVFWTSSIKLLQTLFIDYYSATLIVSITFRAISKSMSAHKVHICTQIWCAAT